MLHCTVAFVHASYYVALGDTGIIIKSALITCYQFKQLLTEQLTQQLLQVLQPQNVPATIQTNFAVLSLFENFDSKKEKFYAYIERFEAYTNIKSVTDNKNRAQLLLASIGSTHYNKFGSLSGI